METLVIYDSTGKIYLTEEGVYILPQGDIQYLETNIPNGKYITSVDTTSQPHQPILENAPLSEIDELKQTVADLTEIVLMGGV